MAETTVAGVLTELTGMEDPQAREVNERHGDDHGVNLGSLRAVAADDHELPWYDRSLIRHD